jgi:ribosomal protein S18 acetylase RimI-like enzyme
MRSRDVATRPATPADAAAIARVHVDAWRETYRGLVPAGYLAALSYAERERMWTEALGERGERRGVIYVAEAPTGRVVGFASGGRERGGDPVHTGEVYALYVLAEHQGRGVGRALLARVFEALAAAGFPSALLWVLEANPSRGFYERLGGRRLRSQTIEIAGAPLEEVAYGWERLAAAAERLRRGDPPPTTNGLPPHSHGPGD